MHQQKPSSRIFRPKVLPMSLFLKITAYAFTLLIFAGAALAVFSQWQAYRLERLYPNRGELIDIGGYRMNSIHVARPEAADLPALVFVHGASGNLLDPMTAFYPALAGRAEMLFVDRPGHGYSERGGPENASPEGQADAIAALMDKRKISKAIIVGHSFGGAIVAAFAVRHADKVAGLVFLSAATHPWPGGVDWYYNLANLPVLGPLFCHTMATPAGLLQIDGGVRHVFAPNRAPSAYAEETALRLVLRPANFCNNARDVANLYDAVVKIQPRYQEIRAKTVIITGDSDDIVYEEIHSRGLKRDIAGSELIWIRHLGHKPDYIATDIAISAMEKIAGAPRDLQTLARDLERVIEQDRMAAHAGQSAIPRQMPVKPSEPI